MKVQVQVTCVGLLKGLQDLLGDLDFSFLFFFASLSLKLRRKNILGCEGMTLHTLSMTFQLRWPWFLALAISISFCSQAV